MVSCWGHFATELISKNLDDEKVCDWSSSRPLSNEKSAILQRVIRDNFNVNKPRNSIDKWNLWSVVSDHSASVTTPYEKPDLVLKLCHQASGTMEPL